MQVRDQRAGADRVAGRLEVRGGAAAPHAVRARWEATGLPRAVFGQPTELFGNEGFLGKAPEWPSVSEIRPDTPDKRRDFSGRQSLGTSDCENASSSALIAGSAAAASLVIGPRFASSPSRARTFVEHIENV